jgi:hypothetical protein
MDNNKVMDRIVKDLHFACQLLDEVPPSSPHRVHTLYAKLLLVDLLALVERVESKKSKMDARVVARAGAEIIDLAKYRRRV